MSHTFGCKLRHPWEDRPKAGMESFDVMSGRNFHRYLRTSYITCREMWLQVLKVPPCATDQVICARIIEPRQRSPHFCCHQTFMCWHSLTSCLPLTHGPLVHVDLPFNRLPSTQKTKWSSHNFLCQPKGNFYTQGTVKPLQVCHALVFQGYEKSLAGKKLVLPGGLIGPGQRVQQLGKPDKLCCGLPSPSSVKCSNSISRSSFSRESVKVTRCRENEKAGDLSPEE